MIKAYLLSMNREIVPVTIISVDKHSVKCAYQDSGKFSVNSKIWFFNDSACKKPIDVKTWHLLEGKDPRSFKRRAQEVVFTIHSEAEPYQFKEFDDAYSHLKFKTKREATIAAINVSRKCKLRVIVLRSCRRFKYFSSSAFLVDIVNEKPLVSVWCSRSNNYKNCHTRKSYEEASRISIRYPYT